jgi:hypothetical protein
MHEDHYMYYLLQLLLGVFAVYGAFNFKGDTRLYTALACLISMFVIGRLDKERFEKKEARKNFLKSEMEKISNNDATVAKDQDLFIVNSLLWPKGELVLTDAVHFVMRDLGLRVSTGGKYGSVDRMVSIPDSRMFFGVEILLSDEHVEKNHPKIDRALEFEKEKKENEKTVIIASTHIHHPLSEREGLNEISIGLNEFLAGCQITLMSAYTLYQLWQKSKAGETDIREVFKTLYSHRGGIFSFGEATPSPAVSLGA